MISPYFDRAQSTVGKIDRRATSSGPLRRLLVSGLSMATLPLRSFLPAMTVPPSQPTLCGAVPLPQACSSFDALPIWPHTYDLKSKASRKVGTQKRNLASASYMFIMALDKSGWERIAMLLYVFTDILKQAFDIETSIARGSVVLRLRVQHLVTGRAGFKFWWLRLFVHVVQTRGVPMSPTSSPTSNPPLPPRQFPQGSQVISRPLSLALVGSVGCSCGHV